MPKALFRFDAGPGIGSGHMMRCLALADALDLRGWTSVCAVGAATLSMLPAARRSVAIELATDGAADGAAIIARQSGDIDLAVVDHYGLDATFEATLRAGGARVVAIDDLAIRLHDADVVIDAAPRQPADRYDSLIASNVLRLLGSDYALLRPEFEPSRTCRKELASRSAAGAPPRILVSMGAIDGKNVSAQIVQALASLHDAHSVTVVLGSEAPHSRGVEALVQSYPKAARLLVNVEDMAALYSAHDIAIGAPGTSALERASVGLPQILIQTADNQAMVARGFDGAAIRLGDYSGFDPDKLRSAVVNLIGDPGRRDRLAGAAQNLVDGLGAQRVAALLTSAIYDRFGAPLAARRLRSGDSDMLFAWQTAPDTRRYFHDPSPPTRARHEEFLRARLADRQSVAEIITRHDLPVAMVRADRGDDNWFAVSVVVEPAARGQGVGVAALKYLDALLPGTDLKAVVIEGNAASIAAFRAAGFGVGRRRKLLVEPNRNASAVITRDRIKAVTSRPKGLFVLGTVQLGMEYGVANRTGQPRQEQAFDILNGAVEEGVTTIDTAHVYGCSEQVIGAWLCQRHGEIAIVTKVPALGGGGPERADRAFRESLDRLGRSSVDMLLLHRASDWYADGMADWLDGVRTSGLTSRVGVSAYSEHDIPDDPRVDAVQIPGNIFNQAALTSGAVRDVLARGGVVHVRSVFAQGALLADPATLPSALASARPLIARFHALAVDFGVQPAVLAIGAVRYLLQGCEVVLGVETAAQVTELAAAARATVPDACIQAAIALGASAPIELFDTRSWKALNKVSAT